MPGRFGPRLDRGLGLDRVDRPQKARKAGSYQTRERGGGQYGGTAYPTVLEAYNRDSDYKRWRTGLDYWQGTGKSWADLERSYLIRSFRESGALPGPMLTTVTLFPSTSSPDSSWTVVNRRRGALVLPQPLRQQDISFDTSLRDPAQHRLILDVSATLSPTQLEVWTDFIGDQFEDSATGTLLPQGLLDDPIDTIAYTLVEVDDDNGRLLFDLSRPYMRRRPNRSIPRAFWQRILYEPTRPLSWRNDGSRYLCSSHRFTCSCPDYSGMRTANLIGGEGGSQDRFPRPTAGRTIDGRWEAEIAGYRSRFRDLSFRADQRRECKHIHAARWSVGYPYYEPSDYEIGNPDRLYFTGRDTDPGDAEILRYHGRRDLTLDRLAPALAESAGRLVDTRDTIPEDESAGVQPGRPAVLWTTTREPDPSRCRVDDWWLQRGTNILRVFDATTRRFVETNVIDGEARPMIELVEPDQLIPVETGFTRDLTATIEAIGAVSAPPAFGQVGLGYVLPLYWDPGYAEGEGAPPASIEAEGLVSAPPASAASAAPAASLQGTGAINASPATAQAQVQASSVAAVAAVGAPSGQGGAIAPTSTVEASGAVVATPGAPWAGYVAPGYWDIGYAEGEGAPPGSVSIVAAAVINAPLAQGNALAPGASLQAAGNIFAGSQTMLLLNFDGANNGTVFTDSSEFNWSMSRTGSTAVTTTSDSKFGTACLDPDSRSWVVSPVASDFAAGTGNFTIELWLKDAVENNPRDGIFLMRRVNSATGLALRHSATFWYIDGTGHSTTYAGRYFESWTTWRHVAVICNNGVIRLYIEGTQVGINFPTNGTNFDFEEVNIGSRGNNLGLFSGLIDGFRYVKGRAVWTSNFTPPTAPY